MSLATLKADLKKLVTREVETGRALRAAPNPQRDHEEAQAARKATEQAIAGTELRLQSAEIELAECARFLAAWGSEADELPRLAERLDKLNALAERGDGGNLSQYDTWRVAFQCRSTAEYIAGKRELRDRLVAEIKALKG